MKFCPECGAPVIMMGMCAKCGKPLFFDERQKPDYSFELSYSYGMMMNSGEAYTLEITNGKPTVWIKLNGVPRDKAERFDADQLFCDKIKELVKKYNAASWDGFRGHDSRVMDGASFSLTITDKDGTHISASGYMAYPDNFGPFYREAVGLFTDLYEERHPNYARMLEDYYNNVLVPKYGKQESRSFRYGYVAASENSIAYAKYELEPGILSHKIADLTRDRGSKPGLDMVVVYGDNSEDNGFTYNTVRFEFYTVGEDKVVRFVGGKTVDGSLTTNDGILSLFFLKLVKDHCVAGYCCYRKYKVARTERFRLYLYDIYCGELEVLAENDAVNAQNHTWTDEELAEFSETAQKYGFDNSYDNWHKDRQGPYVLTNDTPNVAVSVSSFSTCNNANDVNDKLAGLSAGDPVEGYFTAGDLNCY